MTVAFEQLALDPDEPVTTSLPLAKRSALRDRRLHGESPGAARLLCALIKRGLREDALSAAAGMCLLMDARRDGEEKAA